MVKIEVSFKELQKKIGKICEEEIEQTLFDMGFELENLEGDVLTIDITAERPDLLSLQGISRALQSYLGIKNEKEYVVKKEDYVILVKESVKKVRPYTVAAVIKNLSLNTEKIKE